MPLANCYRDFRTCSYKLGCLVNSNLSGILCNDGENVTFLSTDRSINARSTFFWWSYSIRNLCFAVVTLKSYRWLLKKCVRMIIMIILPDSCCRPPCRDTTLIHNGSRVQNFMASNEKKRCSPLTSLCIDVVSVICVE